MTNIERLQNADGSAGVLRILRDECPAFLSESMLTWLHENADPITDALRDYINHAISIGFFWVAQDSDGGVFVFRDKPEVYEEDHLITWMSLGKPCYRETNTLFNDLFSMYPQRCFNLHELLSGGVE